MRTCPVEAAAARVRVGWISAAYLFWDGRTSKSLPFTRIRRLEWTYSLVTKLQLRTKLTAKSSIKTMTTYLPTLPRAAPVA